MTLDAAGKSRDDVAVFLKELRAQAGDPSYAELVRRVMSQRMARGMSEWEARVGRTTVYDAFRPERRALDRDLVTDLVRALGGSEQALVVYLERRQEPSGKIGTEQAGQTPDGVASTTSDPAGPLRQPRLGWRVQAAVSLGCVAINLAGRVLVNTTHVPLYLDMVGTAIAAIILGPWLGAGVGVATSLAGVVTNGWVSAGFVPVEVVGALLWGYGFTRFRLGQSVPKFLLLSVLVAVSCSFVAVPIIVWSDRGVTGSGADQLTRSMDVFWHNLFAAVASQNVLTSLADKLISGFIALAVAESVLTPATDVAGARAVRSPWMRFRQLRPREPVTQG